jgi:hypothetical protein
VSKKQPEIPTIPDALLVECPRCGVEPGARCNVKRGWHEARLRRFEELSAQAPLPKTEDFTCEHCGAKPGKPCVAATGKRAGKTTCVHKSRITQAFRAQKGRTDRGRFESTADGGRRDEDGFAVPALPDAWRALFLRSTLRTGFALVLTQPMLEQLCAVADQVDPDRSVFRHSMGLAQPLNHTTVLALERRGLVRHRGTRVLRGEAAERSVVEDVQRYQDHICDTWELTPAGELLVKLLKTTGVFVEQAAATDLKARREAVAE